MQSTRGIPTVLMVQMWKDVGESKLLQQLRDRVYMNDTRPLHEQRL